MTDSDDDDTPRHGRFARWRKEERPPDQTMANWALGLSLAGCLCGAPALVAVALAVVVLDRSIGGPDHGRAKAVAALVIAVAQVVALAYLVPRAADWLQPEAPPPDAQVPSIGEFRAADLHTGDCFDDEDLRSGRPGGPVPGDALVTVVPCNAAHLGEVVYARRVEETPYPRANVRTGCRRALAAYVAFRAEMASVILRWYVPGPGDRHADDGRVLCFALPRDGRLRNHSLADPNQIP